MHTRHRLIAKAIMVGAMALSLLTPARATASSSQCGQCTTLYICLYFGEAFCQSTCGKPYAGCASGAEYGCSLDAGQITYILCGDETRPSGGA